MKKNYLWAIALMLLLTWSSNYGQYEWSNISVPANAGTGKTWDLVESMSDDFNYSTSFSAGEYANRSNFGSNNQWYNFYHNSWDGPGYTYWDNSNVSVDGDNLVITAGYTSETTKGGSYGVASGCVTSNDKVTYPVYVESSVSVANISLASCFWLLSPDDTEEIDIIENYGGVDFFKNYTHISHHSFVRNPFTDYQPRDWNSWYGIDEVTNAGGWGDFCWNGGNRRYMRMGVYWIGPKHWEYYINGQLVRVMYYNAMATNINGTWQYTYYNSTTPDANGYVFPTNGSDSYSLVTLHTTSNNYNFSTLQAASNASNGFSVIDTGWFQGGDDNDVDGNGVTVEPLGFTKELDIIINIESQSWLLNSTPSNADLNDPSKNQMKVDWVRVYKPTSNNIAVTGLNLTPATLSLAVGETGNLTGAVVPSNASDKRVLFTSSNTNVATVNQSGVITAIVAGTTTITGSSMDGNRIDTSVITVTNSSAGGNIFYITNRATGKKVSTIGNANFTNIQQVAATTTNNSSRWKMVASTGGYFYLENQAASNRYIRPQSSATTGGDSDGSSINQVPNTYRGSFTQWRKVNTTGGYFYLQNRATGMYFRPENGTNSSKLQQRPTSYGGTWTQWIFTDVNTGAAVNFKVDKEIFNIETDLIISKNPVNSGDLINVTFQNSNNNAHVYMYDVSGRVLRNLTVKSNQVDIKTDGLQGMYFVKVEGADGGKELTAKVLVK